MPVNATAQLTRDPHSSCVSMLSFPIKTPQFVTARWHLDTVQRPTHWRLGRLKPARIPRIRRKRSIWKNHKGTAQVKRISAILARNTTKPVHNDILRRPGTSFVCRMEHPIYEKANEIGTVSTASGAGYRQSSDVATHPAKGQATWPSPAAGCHAR
jgi:hypothetical protein